MGSQVRRTQQTQGLGSLRAAPSAAWPSEPWKLLGIQTLLGDAVEVIHQYDYSNIPIGM